MSGLIKLNFAQEKYQKLIDEGKVTYFNSPEQLERMKEFEENLVKSKREYIIKNAQSIQSAKEFIITH